jgi:hypothetical protein
MQDVGIFYGRVVHFTVFWYILWAFGIGILWQFGMFLPVLVFCSKKNLATLLQTSTMQLYMYIVNVRVYNSVARLFLVQHTKTGKIYQNDHKECKMDMK